ncbi:MAG: hypothetical protein AAGE13_11005 [Pseudomonadota bacterium]
MDTMPQFVAKAARLCRSVAAMLIAGVLRRLDSDEVEARLAARALREQITVTALVLVHFSSWRSWPRRAAYGACWPSAPWWSFWGADRACNRTQLKLQKKSGPQ